MKTLGGFPIIEGDAWNSSQFNRSRLFVEYPTLMFDFFNLALEVNKINPYSNFSYVYVSQDFIANDKRKLIHFLRQERNI